MFQNLTKVQKQLVSSVSKLNDKMDSCQNKNEERSFNPGDVSKSSFEQQKIKIEIPKLMYSSSNNVNNIQNGRLLLLSIWRCLI